VSAGSRGVIRMYFNTQVRFGAGVLETLPKELKLLGISRPLLVTDPGLVAAGLAARVQALLPEGVPVFIDLPANPATAHVEAAVVCYREAGCDGIVALGGGSPIDLAKGVALLATHDGPLEQYAMIYGGLARITAAGGLGSGAITITGSAARVAIGNGVSLTNDFIVDAPSGMIANGVIQYEGSGTGRLAGGTVTVLGSPTSGGAFATTGGGTLVVEGPVTAPTPDNYSRSAGDGSATPSATLVFEPTAT
jgi:hypothetical protein